MNLRRRLHIPTIPPISTLALSRIPTPLRTSRILPSLPTPEHVTMRLCRCLPLLLPLPSRFPSSTLELDVSTSPQGRKSKSTMGPRLSYSSSTFKYVISANNNPCSYTSSSRLTVFPPVSAASSLSLVNVVLTDTGESSICTN